MRVTCLKYGLPGTRLNYAVVHSVKKELVTRGHRAGGKLYSFPPKAVAFLQLMPSIHAGNTIALL